MDYVVCNAVKDLFQIKNWMLPFVGVAYKKQNPWIIQLITNKFVHLVQTEVLSMEKIDVTNVTLNISIIIMCSEF